MDTYWLLVHNKAVRATCQNANEADGPNHTCRILKAVRASQPPAIDGDLTDEVWKSSPVATTFIDPTNYKPMQDQTEVYLLYDDKAIYAAFKCFGSKPNEIVARDIQHGSSMSGEDTVSIMIDLFYTRASTCSTFEANSLGTQFEYMRSARGKDGVDWRVAIRREADK